MNTTDLDNAQREIASLLHKCEKALENSMLSPGRTTLLKRRIAALKISLELIEEKQPTQE